MKVRDFVNMEFKYYYNGNYTTCVIKATFEVKTHRNVLFKVLTRDFEDVDPYAQTFSVKGVAKCASGDAYSAKIGEAVARAKAKRNLYTKLYKIYSHCLHEILLHSDELESIANFFGDKAMTEDDFIVKKMTES